MSTEADIAVLKEVLKKVKIFNHVSPPVLDPLSQTMTLVNFKANEMVFKKGDVGDALYFIVKGNVKLHEQEMVITEMGEGDFFGEFSLLDNEPRSLSVTCTIETTLAALHRDDFYQVLKERPESTQNIIEALIKRIRLQNNKIFTFLKDREKELSEEVNKKTSDLQSKNTELSQALEKLKIAQQQLVVKEMLASLGQLTAGIAHTIKNPLNFVHNFSEISAALIDEIVASNNQSEKKELLQDLKINIEKINSHGMRANSIVENMLQHSIIGSGEKQLININELTEAVTHIAYKTFQSGGNGFRCEIIKEFNDNVPEVMVSTKEISRVLLNILNNAFYATDERIKKEKNNKKYAPEIKVSTHFADKHVIIAIKDNGTGIAADIKEKIFEPFFTTKLSRQSNGLGLSMSNEIIKMYGGEIKFNIIEGGTEFLIFIPA